MEDDTINQETRKRDVPEGAANLTVIQAARRLCESVSKLYQMISSRAITHYRIGGKIIIRAADIESYLLSCRVGAVERAPFVPRTRVKLKHVNPVRQLPRPGQPPPS